MNDLAQIMAEAHYQTTIKQQRELLVSKFQDACVVPHNGGIFDITPEFLAGLKLRVEHSETNQLWVVDRNSTCIKILDVDKFIQDSIEIYNQATEEFGNEWQALRTKRSVEAIITK